MIKKLIYIFLTFLICLGLSSHYTVFAIDPDLASVSTKKSASSINPNDYKPKSTTTVEDASKLKKIGNVIIGVIRTVGSIASIGVLIVLGIKYMAGSVEEKAQYKQSMVPYVLGAFLVFGITNILGLIIEVAGLFG